jgi:aldehyde dehydrogenase (NAD+)
MGAYHGKIGFDTMSHRRSVLTRSTKIDPSLMYPPYTAKKEKLVKRGMTLGDPRDSVAKVRGRFRRR